MYTRILKLSLIISLCALLSVASNAYAANQGTGYVTIKNVTNWGHNGEEQLLIQTIPANTTNPANCGSTAWIVLDSIASDISRSMILAAKMANETVNFVIHGGMCDAGNRPIIAAVEIP